MKQKTSIIIFAAIVLVIVVAMGIISSKGYFYTEKKCKGYLNASKFAIPVECAKSGLLWEVVSIHNED